MCARLCARQRGARNSQVGITPVAVRVLSVCAWTLGQTFFFWFGLWKFAPKLDKVTEINIFADGVGDRNVASSRGCQQKVGVIRGVQQLFVCVEIHVRERKTVHVEHVDAYDAAVKLSAIVCLFFFY